MITRICEACKQPYQTFPSVRLRYCSSKCAGRAKQKATMIACAQCGKLTRSVPSTPRQYCSKSCARTALNLTDANPAFARDVTGDKNPMYGTKRSGEANPMFGKRKHLAPRWKGGRKIRKDGYVLVVAPDDHPYPSDVHPNGLKYVLEHRLVMERHLGRYLLPEEVVHHLDENPSNNAIENLELLPNQSAHARLHGEENRRRRE